MRKKLKLLSVAVESAAVGTATFFATGYGIATLVEENGGRAWGENGLLIGLAAVVSSGLAAYKWFQTRWQGNAAGLYDIAATAKSEWDSLDKRKEKIGFAAAAWLAFFNAVMVVNVPVFIVFCSKCDMFESKSLYYRLSYGYYDLLATLPGQGLWLLLGLSPVTWILLYIWTGATGILPWRRPPRTGNDS